MAKKHRFKKNREFKERLEHEEENEEGDIRTFTFHKPKFANDEHHDGRHFDRYKGNRFGKDEERFSRDGKRGGKKFDKGGRRGKKFGKADFSDED